MPKNQKKALILYASYGDGHLQVSRALRENLEQRGIAVKMVDLFAEAHPAFNELTKFLYIKSYSWFPRLYGWIYDHTKHMRHETPLSRWFNSFGLRRLRQILNEEKPDLVINTFPMLVMPILKRKGIVLPTYTVMTDFALHHRWVHRDIDKFYVATEDLKKDVVSLGIAPDRVQVSGIPIKRTFRRPVELRTLYRKYGLRPDKQTLLVMAGSYGVVQGLQAVCREASELSGVQIAIVCGNNKKLSADMKAAFAEQPNVHVFGFLDRIHELMALSSCLITKPGGITLSEALSANLPIVLYRPVPGQERDNANYLASKGAALIAYDSGELVSHLRLLLHESGVLRRMHAAIAELRRPYSADEVAADIVRELSAGAEAEPKPEALGMSQEQAT